MGRLSAPGRPGRGVVGIENAAEIFQAARHPKSFISLDRADHLLMNPQDSRYVGAIIAIWAMKYIGANISEQTPRINTKKQPTSGKN